MTGCQSPPTTEEIHKEYQYFYNQLEEQYQKMLIECEKVYTDPEERKACKSLALSWRNERWTELQRAEESAVNEEWEEARERRKALEEKLREMLPDFPDLRDIFEPLIIGGSMDIDITATPMQQQHYAMSLTGGDIIHASTPNSPVRYRLSGTTALDSDTMSMTMDMGGLLSMTLDTDQFGATFGFVHTGYLHSTAIDGTEITLTIVDDPQNIVETDNNGVGWITLLTTMEHSDEEWNAILPYYNRVRFPLEVQPNGSLDINTHGWVPTDMYVPYIPWASSDYNMDGTLDYDTDFPAFLEDFDEEDLRADQNVDGVWDQEDIDLWLNRFWTDYDNMNG